MREDVEEFIQHHGVKGMHWGVRTKSGRRASSKSPQTVYKKPASQLSTPDLKKRVSRLETEKRYNDLNKGVISDGHKFAKDVLSSVGRGVATSILTGAALYGIKTVLEKKVATETVRKIVR